MIGVLAGAAGQGAFAEIEGEAGPWTYTLGAEATAVLSAGDDGDLVDREGVLFELGGVGGVERVLDNGAEIGARGALRLQRDHPARAGQAGCLGLSGARPAGLFSGVSAGCAPEDAGPRGSLETAYLYIDGGYGELAVGRDLGVAARFYEGPRDALSHARTTDPLLDPSGQGLVRVHPDLTGPAAKISYATPRLVGLRAGVSFTPEADVRGLDRDPVRSLGGAPRPQLESVWEAGLNFSRRFRGPGVRIRAGLGYVGGEVAESVVAGYGDDVSVTSGGVELEWDGFGLGASWLSSDNGLAAGRYDSWSAGMSAERFGLDWSLVASGADDDALGADIGAVGLAAARGLGDGFAVKAGFQLQSIETASESSDSQGFVVEITHSY